MVLILFFILVLNAVAIALTYYCLSNVEKKEKLITIAIGIAVIYVLTSFVYWLSTKDIEIKEVSDMGKNLITFMFVPINSIIILPILAKSYNKYKIGRLASEYFKNRVVVLSVLLVIILIIEFFYFKDSQKGVITLIENNNQKRNETVQAIDTDVNQIEEANTILNNKIENVNSNNENSLTRNETVNSISNTIVSVSNETN